LRAPLREESGSASDTGVSSYSTPSQPKPEAKVDLLENKGGEQERVAWQQQLETNKAQRDNEFQQKLNSIKTGSGTSSPQQKADFRSKVSLDPYGGTPEHTGNTRDRLAALKNRFDKALN